MLPDLLGIKPASFWSPVGHASNWATEDGWSNKKNIFLIPPFIWIYAATLMKNCVNSDLTMFCGIWSTVWWGLSVWILMVNIAIKTYL